MFEALPIIFPDLEAAAAAYVRAQHPGVASGRVQPATIEGFAVVVGDDGGPDRGHLADRRLRLRVLGKGTATYSQSATAELAGHVAASLRVWHLRDSRIADVGDVRGPWAVNDKDTPPEYLITAEVTLLGTTS